MSIDVTGKPRSLSDQVAEEIRVAMTRRRISGRKLALKLGVSAAWVSYRLTGTQPIDLNDLQRIAAVLEVSIVDLLPRGSATVTEANSHRHTGSLTKGRPPGRADRSVRPGGVRRPARLTPPIAA